MGEELDDAPGWWQGYWSAFVVLLGAALMANEVIDWLSKREDPPTWAVDFVDAAPRWLIVLVVFLVFAAVMRTLSFSTEKRLWNALKKVREERDAKPEAQAWHALENIAAQFQKYNMTAAQMLLTVAPYMTGRTFRQIVDTCAREVRLDPLVFERLFMANVVRMRMFDLWKESKPDLGSNPDSDARLDDTRFELLPAGRAVAVFGLAQRAIRAGSAKPDLTFVVNEF